MEVLNGTKQAATIRILEMIHRMFLVDFCD